MKDTFKLSAKICSMMLLLGLFVMSSCKDDAKREVVSDPNPMPKASEVVKQVGENDTVALNPAHGQPGHRCDIKVGAPLNSAPAQTNTATPIMTNGTNSSSTGKLNPAHGQPGHRCDIKVGDPL